VVPLAATLPDWLPRVSPQTSAAIGFSIRTWLASMLALYIAFALQLDAPYWSWITVWIVAQPTPGMLLSKSLYRAIGTIAGAFFAVILIALFAQTPELFVLALALLVGGCTLASNTLTNFRAYATVLAAYTAGIVASDAIDTPTQVWFIALSRGSAILIGIASAVAVTSIFAPHRSEALARDKLLALLKDAARRAAYSWQGDNETRLKIGRQLIVDDIALDTLIDFASAESAVFRVQKNRARSLLAHIFGMISARRSLDAHLFRRGWPRHDALEVFHGVILDFLAEMPGHLERGEIDELIAGLEDVNRQLQLLEPEQDTDSPEEVVSERFVIDRLADLLAHIGGALRDWRSILREEPSKEPRLVLNFHRDLRAARINGLRAFLAVSATGAFWIASAWPHGPGALVFVSIMCSLFSSVPRPDRVGWAFFYASIPAVGLGLLCKFFILPSVAQFEVLVAVVGLLLVPLGLIMANPKTNAAAVAFSLVFLNIMAPTNPMTYDLADSINGALAIEVGILFGTLAFAIIFPPDPRAARRYVTYRIRRGLELMAKLDPIPAFSDWETRMYDRVSRLNDPQNLSGTPGDEWLDAGLHALTLGNELLRLRQGLERGDLPAPPAAAVRGTVAAFGHFVSQPVRAIDEVKGRLIQLGPLDPGPGQPGRREWARTMGALSEINIFLSFFPRS
jgi:uncharacterized membrane protein YccC